MSERYFHGGAPGLRCGYTLVPSPPHATDGCPVCVARSEGRTATAGEMRAWARTLPGGAAVLQALAGAPDDAPIDPPSSRDAVYITTDRLYATWYAARTGGDLYEVRPLAEPLLSGEDHFAPSFTVPTARIIAVIRRNVRLSPAERARIADLWLAADRRIEQATYA